MTEAQPTLLEEARRVMSLLFQDRAAAWDRLRRGAGVVRARIVLRGCTVGSRVNVLGKVRVAAEGPVEIGDRVQFWEGTIPQEILCEKDARVSIGESSVFNYGVSIRASSAIRIGRRCMFGSLVLLHDSNRSKTAPIVIGNDVWVAHGAIIEPGVTIGDGSVVGAGSVVAEDVPPFSLAAGNPAKSTPLAEDEQSRPPKAAGD
jgi:maltose O-acetyltransferase